MPHFRVRESKSKSAEINLISNTTVPLLQRHRWRFLVIFIDGALIEWLLDFHRWLIVHSLSEYWARFPMAILVGWSATAPVRRRGPCFGDMSSLLIKPNK